MQGRVLCGAVRWGLAVKVRQCWMGCVMVWQAGYGMSRYGTFGYGMENVFKKEGLKWFTNGNRNQ